MNKVLLIGVSVLGLFLSSEAYCACTPPIVICNCAFPEFKNGVLSCGPTYCPSGTRCMPMGSCCKDDKVCGSDSFLDCCSDTETCVNKTTCCPTEKPYLDDSGECVQCTEDTHCTGNYETCQNGVCSCKEGY